MTADAAQAQRPVGADKRSRQSADGSLGRIQDLEWLSTDDGAPVVTYARPSHVLRLGWMQGRGSFKVTLTARGCVEVAWGAKSNRRMVGRHGLI